MPKGNKVHPPKNHIELPDYESARSQELQGNTTTVFVFRLWLLKVLLWFFYLCSWILMFSESEFRSPWINLRMVILIITHQMKGWCVWSSVVQNQKRAADRNRQMKVHENEPVTSTAVALSLITCWTQSCPTGSLTSLQRFAWSQPVRWAQSNQYREWNLNFVLLSLPSLSFQRLTFACFLAFLFSFGSWQGLEVKQCCGQLRNVESASGADLEPIRTQKRRGQGRRERERE